jgi:hypothetical protein
MNFGDSWLPYLFLALIAFASALWLGISSSAARALTSLENATITKLDADSAREWFRKLLDRGLVVPDDHSANDFYLLGTFRLEGGIGDPHITVWQHAKEHTQLRVNVFLARRYTLDILTAFNVGQLRTSSEKDAHTLPPPLDGWTQSFTVSNATELLAYHTSALNFLRDATSQIPSIGRADFEQDFPRKAREHLTYVRSIPLWRLRVPYWYLVRRNRLHGKPIREQVGRLRGAV